MTAGNPFVNAIAGGDLALGIPVALLAGAVSFLSPCVLPLVPGYLGYVGGITAPIAAHSDPRKMRRRLVLGVVLFILGFSIVFVGANLAFGAIGFWLLRWGPLITRLMGIFVLGMGLVFLGQFRFLQRSIKLRWAPSTGLAGAPILGIIFAVGWTPCIGPTLAAITALSFNTGSVWQSAVLGLAYCLGLGVPFLLLALGFGWASRTISFLRRHVRAINILGGILLVSIGVLMVSGIWGDIISRLGSAIGSFSTIV